MLKQYVAAHDYDRKAVERLRKKISTLNAKLEKRSAEVDQLQAGLRRAQLQLTQMGSGPASGARE